MSQKNKQYWDEIALAYNEGIGNEGDIRHKLVVNPAIFKLLGDLSGKVVLDAGCGNGYLTRKMAQSAKKVVGIDFTEKLIGAAKNYSNSDNIEFFVGDVQKIDFPNETFDTVLANLVLMDVENINKTLNEFSRVLKQNGQLIVSILHPCFENAHNVYPLKDYNDREIGRVVTNYFDTGLVIDKNQNYQLYHHKLSDYLNAFTKAGFCLEEVVEPKQPPEIKDMQRNHTPMFLIMKLVKEKKPQII